MNPVIMPTTPQATETIIPGAAAVLRDSMRLTLVARIHFEATGEPTVSSDCRYSVSMNSGDIVNPTVSRIRLTVDAPLVVSHPQGRGCVLLENTGSSVIRLQNSPIICRPGRIVFCELTEAAVSLTVSADGSARIVFYPPLEDGTGVLHGE